MSSGHIVTSLQRYKLRRRKRRTSRCANPRETGNQFTVHEGVFAEKGGRLLLGERKLEGLHLTVNPHEKKLVAKERIFAA